MHSWKYSEPVKEYYDFDYVCEIEEQRVCVRCGKQQIKDVHCLGLNPPKYVEIWRNLPNKG